MIGWDFLNLWKIGQAVLNGINPYSIDFSRYPPVTNLFFAIFALLPYLISYALWTGLNLVLYIDALRRIGVKGWICTWVLFTPALFNLMTGEIDLFFLWCATLLPSGGWKAVTAGMMLTLKPQLAAVILPWFLIRWIRKYREVFFKWLGLTVVVHLIPLLFDIEIYLKWINVLGKITDEIIPLSSGIFSLSGLGIPLIILLLPGIGIMIWGLSRDESTSRAAQFLGFPLTRWYDGVLMAGSAPAIVLIPYSWTVFLLAYLVKSNIPLATIPLAVLVWRFARKEISSRAT